MLINISLNIDEQPMVNTSLEALHTYCCSGLDVLFLGSYRLLRSGLRVAISRAAAET